MACPVCGNPSPCAHEQKAGALRLNPVHENEHRSARAGDHSSRGAPSAAAGEARDRSESAPWRREVISRVRQHRARRHKRFDAKATLEFDFQAKVDSSASASEAGLAAPQEISRQELPKIIEFPRPLAPIYLRQDLTQPTEEEQLAEPMLEAPRILEAPEPPAQQMDLLPAFADIELQAEERRTHEELELPPQAAPLRHRIFAGGVDATVVLVAGATFAMGFVKFATQLPQPRLLMLSGLLVCGGLWLIYQYLFLVYLSCTPGMQLAQLELCTLEGGPVAVSLRRWRALASMLSGFALGLGFAWAFVDEDTLGWHDRMTQTCLRRQTV
jgi:uncharacterized RDD family membrane protein YckC